MITAHRIVLAARGLAVALLIAIAFAYRPAPTPPADALYGVLAYALVAALFLAFPRIRSGDLAAMAVCVFSFAELAIGAGAPLHVSRWLLAMAAIGGAVAPLRAQRIRGAACRNGYAPLVERRRRAPVAASRGGDPRRRDCSHSDGERAAPRVTRLNAASSSLRNGANPPFLVNIGE